MWVSEDLIERCDDCDAEGFGAMRCYRDWRERSRETTGLLFDGRDNNETVFVVVRSIFTFGTCE
jgi:hypothetical protein